MRCGLPMTLLAWLLTGCAVEQIATGQWYTISTPEAGACPVLQWHFVVDPERSLAGYIVRDGQERVANLSGRINPDDSFRMTATAVSGQQTAAISGRFTSDASTIAIQGNGAGPACNGQTFTLHIARFLARQGGGGGGGG